MCSCEAILSTARDPHLNERADLRQQRMVTGGQICFWQGGSLWVGRGRGRSDWHAHHAHQVAVSLDGSCLFRSNVATREEAMRFIIGQR